MTSPQRGRATRAMVLLPSLLTCPLLFGGCNASTKNLQTALDQSPRYALPADPLRLAAPAAGPTPAREREPELIIDAHAHLFNVLDLPLAGFGRAYAISHGVPTLIVDSPTVVDLLARIECLVYQMTPEFPGTFDCPRTDIGLARQTLDATLGSDIKAINTLEGALRKSGHAIPKSLGSVLGPLVDTFKIATSDRMTLTRSLASKTPDVDVFVSALVDFDFWTERSVLRDIRDCPNINRVDKKYGHLGIRVQNDKHTQLLLASLRGEFRTPPRTRPQYVLPLVAYNPLRDVVANHCPTNGDGHERESSLDIVKSAIDSGGFVGVKLYPPTGFLPIGNAELPDAGMLGIELDAALEQFYEYCEANDVPILTHANDSNGFGVDFGWRAGPWAWRRVLQAHPKLRVSFGHFGELTGANDPLHRIDCLSWSDGFGQLMSISDHVFADVSFSPGAADDAACPVDVKCPADPDKAPEHCMARCQTETLLTNLFDKSLFFSKNVATNKIAERLMYGSDWWMTEMAGPVAFAGYYARMRGMLKDVDAAAHKDGAFTKAAFGATALAFLGLDDFKVANFKRLRKFICANGLPIPVFLAAGGRTCSP